MKVKNLQELLGHVLVDNDGWYWTIVYDADNDVYRLMSLWIQQGDAVNPFSNYDEIRTCFITEDSEEKIHKVLYNDYGMKDTGLTLETLMQSLDRKLNDE